MFTLLETLYISHTNATCRHTRLTGSHWVPTRAVLCLRVLLCLCHRCLRWGFRFYSAPSKTSSSMFPTVKILWYVSVRFWSSVSASLGVLAALLCHNRLWPHCTCKSRCSLISVHNGQTLITWSRTHTTFVIVRVKLYGIGSTIHTPYILLHHTSYILVCCLSCVQVYPNIQLAVGRLQLQARHPGTHCQTISVIRRSAKTPLGDY